MAMNFTGNRRLDAVGTVGATGADIGPGVGRDVDFGTGGLGSGDSVGTIGPGSIPAGLLTISARDSGFFG